MGSYQSRLDRIENAIAPKCAVHLMVVKDGETETDALVAYAKRNGLAVGEVRPAVFLTEVEARL